MKKLYTLMLLVAAVAVSFTASAKSFTITVDDASRVVVRNSLDSYNIVTFENNSYTFEGVTDESYPFPIQCNSGYQIASANYEGTETSAADPGTTFPTESFSLPVAAITDGATVVITTQEKQVPTITILTDDASLLAVECCYQTIQPVDNVFTAKVTESYGSLTIRIAEDKQDEWGLVKAVSDGGQEYPAYSSTIYVSLSSVKSDMTLTVETENLAESRTATLNVTVNGDPEAVELRRSNSTSVVLAEGTTPVKFNPQTETQFTLSPAVYGKNFYKVTLDGTPVTASYSNYTINATDGSNLVIDVEWPEVYAPVSFTFPNEGTEGAISSVSVNNQNVSDWRSEDFSVKLGSTLGLTFDTNRYTITGATLNGQSISTYSYSTTVTEETPLNFVITAEKKPEYNVTFICENYEHAKVYNGYGYNESERIALTGEETTFTVSQGYPYIKVSAMPGYRVTDLVDGAGNTLSTSSTFTVSGDIEIFATIEEISRPNSFTVYVEPTEWSYRCITLSQSDNTLRTDYIGDDLPTGYSVINFADFDLPLNISGYPSLYLYRNDEPATLNYGSLSELADGDVLKMFANEPTSYSVTYTISEEVSVEIEHDHANTIENPSTHTVLQGTEVVITPAVEESPVARVAARTAAPVVKVNDESVSPNEEGKYVFAVNADSNVSVEPGIVDGIDAVKVSDLDADAPVYNLQGIRVGKVSDLRQLPAGLYISGGLKLRN